jgi:hypothetical protein
MHVAAGVCNWLLVCSTKRGLEHRTQRRRETPVGAHRLARLVTLGDATGNVWACFDMLLCLGRRPHSRTAEYRCRRIHDLDSMTVETEPTLNR